MRADVLIIGAGSEGCSAAVAASRAGLTVTMLDVDAPALRHSVVAPQDESQGFRELLLRSALAHDAVLVEMEKQSKHHDVRLTRLEDFMDRLVRIVEIHERPITGLEGGEQ